LAAHPGGQEAPPPGRAPARLRRVTRIPDAGATYRCFDERP
jgi:hypothetical protein